MQEMFSKNSSDENSFVNVMPIQTFSFKDDYYLAHNNNCVRGTTPPICSGFYDSGIIPHVLLYNIYLNSW